jgi:hypothetical protein
MGSRRIVGTPVATALLARAVDANGSGVVGIAVTFTLTAGGGAFLTPDWPPQYSASRGLTVYYPIVSTRQTASIRGCKRSRSSVERLAVSFEGQCRKASRFESEPEHL